MRNGQTTQICINGSSRAAAACVSGDLYVLAGRGGFGLAGLSGTPVEYRREGIIWPNGPNRQMSAVG